MVPRLLFTAVATAGLAAALSGTAMLTVAAPTSRLSGQVGGGGAIVTAPGVAALTGEDLTVTVAGAPGPVFVGIGRQQDVESWVGGPGDTRITGWRDGRLDTAAGAPSGTLPDPAAADVWAEAAAGEGTVTLDVPAPAPHQALAVVADGGEVTFTWRRSAIHPGGPPLLVGGLVVLVLGLRGLARVNRTRQGRRPPGPRTRTRTRAPAAMTRTRTLTMTMTTALALASPVALSGCASLVVATAPIETSGPALTESQAHRVLAAVVDQLATVAAGTGRVETATRLAEPAAAWAPLPAAGPLPEAAASGAHGLVQLVAALDPTAPDTPGRAERVRFLLPVTDSWPRTFLAIVDTGSGTLVPVLTSGSARDPYRLSAVMPLVDGQQIEGLPPPSRGGDPVPSPSAAAAATPSTRPATTATAEGPEPLPDVVAALPQRLVDVLTRGDASPHAPEFAPDPVSVALTERARTLSAAAVDARGTARTDYAVPPGGSAPAVLDDDGNALVVVTVTATTVVTARPGADPVPVPDRGPGVGGLARMATVAGAPRLTVTATAVTLLSVPAERGNIRMLAAAEGVTGAAGG